MMNAGCAHAWQFDIALGGALRYALSMNNEPAASDTTKIERFIAALTEKGAIDPEVLHLPGENSFADAMIVAGAGTRRQAQAISDAITDLCGDCGYTLLGLEGYAGGDWILLDCDEIIVHILRGEFRDLYRLEDLWAKSAPRKEAF